VSGSNTNRTDNGHDVFFFCVFPELILRDFISNSAKMAFETTLALGGSSSVAKFRGARVSCHCAK